MFEVEYSCATFVLSLFRFAVSQKEPRPSIHARPPEIE